jgi:basic endochitinase B
MSPPGRRCLNLVGNPNRVATDPVVAFKTAIWFWMTVQSCKPSPHAVIMGHRTLSAADRAAGHSPVGYIINSGVECSMGPKNSGANHIGFYKRYCNMLNGGVECSMGPKNSGANHIGFYKRYCDMLSVGYWSNLNCYRQRKFG